jgi:hypothetical protein
VRFSLGSSLKGFELITLAIGDPLEAQAVANVFGERDVDIGSVRLHGACDFFRI